MESNRKSRIIIDHQQWSEFFEELQSESDRGATILAAAWIENLLELKLRSLFAKGNSNTRQRLFGLNGPFSAFSSKILAVHALGWIDSDTYGDIKLVQKIRNHFAHELHGIEINSPKIHKLIDQFTTPNRYYYDWNEFGAVATSNGKGVIFYAGDPPEDAGDPLDIQRFRYLRSVSLLVAEVSASLNLAIRIHELKDATDSDL